MTVASAGAAPTRPRSGPRWLAAVAGLVAVVVIVVGIVTAVHRSGHGSSAASTPAGATEAYYGALQRNDAKAAFDLLCPAQQAEGLTAFTGNVADDTKTGTGIKAFTTSGPAVVQGQDAAVPGTVVLADGTSTPIQVLVLHTGSRWGVCSSNLGGVLPGPGASAAPSA